MFKNEAGWIQAYTDKGAYWEHDGNPLRPHALLTSGKHSCGFFNSREIIPHEELLREASADLLNLFVRKRDSHAQIELLEQVSCVVGPQTGATKLAESLSNELAKLRGRACKWASPAKVGEGSARRMVFDNDATPRPDDLVLLCEDVVTTGGSLDLTKQAVLDCRALVLTDVLILVNRSGRKRISDWTPIGLIERDLPVWSPDECPICKTGSEAIHPKDPINWARLTAVY